MSGHCSKGFQGQRSKVKVTARSSTFRPMWRGGCVVSLIFVLLLFMSAVAPCGAGAPLFPPLSIYFLIFSPFYFSLSFIGFTYFLLLSIPSVSTRIVSLRFQAGGRRRRPNLGLVVFFCFFECVCNLCYLYSLVTMHCGVFWFTFVCSFSALTLLVGSFDP